MCDGVPLTETTTHNSISPAKHSSKKKTSTSCLTLSILRLGFQESRTTTYLSTLKRRTATVLPSRFFGSSTARVGLNSKHPRAHKISPIGSSHLSQFGSSRTSNAQEKMGQEPPISGICPYPTDCFFDCTKQSSCQCWRRIHTFPGSE